MLHGASTFEEWEEAALTLDNLLGLDLWRQDATSPLYDYYLINERLAMIETAREEADVHALVNLLRSGLVRNLGNITAPKLYNRTFAGTKYLIEEYITQVAEAIEDIGSLPTSTAEAATVAAAAATAAAITAGGGPGGQRVGGSVSLAGGGGSGSNSRVGRARSTATPGGGGTISHGHHVSFEDGNVSTSSSSTGISSASGRVLVEGGGERGGDKKGRFRNVSIASPSSHMPDGGMMIATMSTQAKLDFIHDTRQAFGRSALVLQGGAIFGLCHLGVVKALFLRGLLPRIIVGTATGALIGALVAVHSEEELPRVLKGDGIDLSAFASKGKDPVRHNEGLRESVWSRWATLVRRVQRFRKEGYFLDVKVLEECIRSNVGDLTFEEAYHRSKRVLNITVATAGHGGVPTLLNYLTAPNVVCTNPKASLDRWKKRKGRVSMADRA